MGRCVERILVDVASTKPPATATLGKIISDTAAELSVPEELKEALVHGFLVARNQAGHVWTSASDEELTVDEESVENCFRIVQELHYELYERPKRLNSFVAKMKGVLANKKQGEKKDA